MKKQDDTSENMIPAATTLALLPMFAAIQMATGLPLLNGIQLAAEEENVTKRLALVVVGPSFYTQIYNSAENHLEALDKELEYRKKFSGGWEPPFYIRISNADIEMPPVKLRS